MKTRKLISLLLALMMFVSVVPFYASAAEPIALTEANVTVWPTASGEIWFGQKINEGVTLIGGEVQYDGAVVAGRFEFIDSDIYPTSGGINIAALKFIPENFDSYTGFEIEYAWDVLYNVNPVTPVLVDENAPPVATEVEAGARLSTSTISGAAIKNPITNEIITDVVWNWESSRTKVNESGYYPARATVPSSNGGYNPLTVNIYVRIAGDIPETAIAEYPTVPELTYNPNVTWADIELTGGKAVVKGTETEIEGSFTIKNLTAVPNAKSTELTIVFTPANAEEALPNEFTIPVKVNALPISFGEDYKGTSIDDPFVYEVEPGTMMRDILSYIKGGLLNYPTSSVTKIEDANSKAENGKVYKVTVLNYTNTNYTGSEAYIKTVFKDVEFTPTVKRSTGSELNKFFIDCGDYRPEGTFTVYCNGEEIAEVKRGVAFDCEVYNDEGGTYEITAKYNPIENDYFIVSDALWSITVAPVRHIKVANTYSMPFTVNGNSGHTATIRTGDIIVLEYTMPEFAYFVIKDGNGKTVELDGVDVNEKKITFTMPDHDLDISVKTPAQIEREEAIANCDHLCHSDNELIRLFWNIICMFFRLLNVQQYCDCGELHYSAPLFNFGA
ncbi:MAG: hypothetical protein IJA31_04215 [Clostridia bacterium]|nr:hypothetical protein [Clostridia bacterium]